MPLTRGTRSDLIPRNFAHNQASLEDINPLPFLKSLILCLHGHNGLPGLLATFTTPALRRLRVAEALLQPDPVGTLVLLVSRSGCALEEICITGSSFPEHLYRDALPDVASFKFKRAPDKKNFSEWGSEDDDGELSGEDVDSDNPSSDREESEE